MHALRKRRPASAHSLISELQGRGARGPRFVTLKHVYGVNSGRRIEQTSVYHLRLQGSVAGTGGRNLRGRCRLGEGRERRGPELLGALREETDHGHYELWGGGS